MTEIWRSAMLLRLSLAIVILPLIVGSFVRPALAQDANTTIGILLAAGDVSHCGTEDFTKPADETAKLIRAAIADAKGMGRFLSNHAASSRQS
jgi:hypothetical protein